MAPNAELQTKVGLLKKLFEQGVGTEKELNGLTLEDILYAPGITVNEMKELVILQKSVKKNRLFSYLSGILEEKEE